MRVPLVLPHAAIGMLHIRSKAFPTLSHREVLGAASSQGTHHRGAHFLLQGGNRPPTERELWLWQEGKTNLSHDGLNPAHVPCWWVNNPTLWLSCGRKARKSRHRRIKKPRRFERLAATSQLSLW